MRLAVVMVVRRVVPDAHTHTQGTLLGAIQKRYDDVSHACVCVCVGMCALCVANFGEYLNCIHSAHVR